MPVVAMKPVERTVRLGTGLDHHLLEWGDPSRGHTVLLLHGFLDLAWSWARVVEAGLERFHVLAPDLRGHGDSSWVGAGGYYYFADYLADLESLLSLVEKAPRLSIVGHSMGGNVAAYYTGTFPDRIHKLVLMEGLGWIEHDDTSPERVRAWLHGWRRAREKPPRDYATVEDAAARLRANDPLLDQAYALELARRGTRVTSEGRLRFKHDPLHLTQGPYPFRVAVAQRFWSSIACPVLLLEGDQSTYRFADEQLAQRRAFLKDSRRQIIEGAGHLMQRHQPAAVARAIATFLDGET